MYNNIENKACKEKQSNGKVKFEVDFPTSSSAATMQDGDQQSTIH